MVEAPPPPSPSQTDAFNVIIEKVHGLLSKAGSEERKQIREAIKAELLRADLGRHPIQHYKHVYFTSGFSNVTQSQVNYILTTLALGTGTNNRLGNFIRVHKIIFKETWVLNTFALSTTAPQQQSAVTALIVDKIPETPGTAQDLWEGGANPPDGSTGIPFTNLGSSLASAANPNILTCVVNPSCVPFYEFMRNRTHHFPIKAMDDSDSSVNYVPGPALTKQTNWVTHFHGMIVSYAGSGTSNAFCNQIQYSVRGAVNTANMGYLLYHRLACDVWFEDYQYE